MASSATIFRKLATEFPCLVPSDSQFRSYSGFMKVGEKEFRLSVASDCSSFQADNELREVIEPCMARVTDFLKNSANVHEFLVEVRDLIERQLTSADDQEGFESGLPPAHFYERVLSEITRIGWKNVSSMSESMRVLDLMVTDSGGRKHSVIVTLPADYPGHMPKCVSGLPVDFGLNWGKDSSLSSIVRQFHKLVEHYQDFFRAMEDLDRHAWVLEPEHPTMRETYRRVALQKHCSMRIEIDPRAPIKGFPDVRFLGSEVAIAPFRDRLNQHIHLWDTSGKALPRENLERVLAVTLPKHEVEDGLDEEDMILECGICYSYRLEDAVPDVLCDLAECAKPYHKACLVEWLRALPDTRESFGTISGCCVYCEQTMSVSL